MPALQGVGLSARRCGVAPAAWPRDENSQGLSVAAAERFAVEMGRGGGTTRLRMVFGEEMGCWYCLPAVGVAMREGVGRADVQEGRRDSLRSILVLKRL